MATPRSPIRYARSGELSIAYQVIGAGPVNVVIVPGFISNLEMMPDAYPYQLLLERLGAIGRCVLFDKRAPVSPTVTWASEASKSVPTTSEP
jgi:hypothetical protein